MSKSLKQILKHYLSFSRSDRNAIVIVSVLIFVVFIANVILKNVQPNTSADYSELKALMEKWEKVEAEKRVAPILFDFDPNTVTKNKLDSLSIPDYVKKNLLNYRKAGGNYKTLADVRKIYGMNDSIFALIESHIQIKVKNKVATVPKKNARKAPTGFFDPNNTSVSELLAFGFSNYQANNLVSYHEKGGVFNTSSDLLKIYGIDSSFYNEVAGFIQIEKVEQEVTAIPEKIILLELNSADTVGLMKLSGIGSTYAERIIKYRNLLGGFYSKEQLKEIYNFPLETYNNIQNKISVDTIAIVPLRINFSEFSELLRHPYLNKKQVSALTRKREASGSFKSITELQSVEGFDPELIMKIRPYLTCR